MKPARDLRTLHPARVASAFAVLVGAAAGADPPSDAGATVRIREIYVPYSELSARAGADPRGIVLTLDEYRKLVLDALRESTPRPSAELPPIESAITSASYRGRVDGKAARIVGSLRVRLPSAGWVRCDLGEALAGLSSVQVDGQPGWIILVDGPTPGAAQRAHLLLRGAGDHDVRLVFSVAAVESEDRWSVAGALPRAPAGLLELEVPGSVDAEADPPFLQVVRESRTSRLILATGSAERFRIAWRRSRTESQVDAVLRAEHRIVFRLARSAPSFAWEAAIGIARRKADSITLREPAGCTVVRVDGERVQAWERTPQGLVVHLADSSASDFRLRLAGLLAPPAGSVTIEPPALVGAVVDAGTIVLEELGDTRVVVASTTEIDEVSAREASLPGEEAAPELPIGSRCFRYRSAAARLTARLEERAARLECRGVEALRISETRAQLEAIFRVTAVEGRVWALRFTYPAPWRLLDLTAASGPGAAPASAPLRHQEAQMNGVRSLAVELEHAVEPGKPLEIRATFEHVGFEGERGWERKEFDAELPAIDCDRSRTDLGLFLDASMDALLSGLPGWRTLDEAEGVKENLAGAAAALRADSSRGDPPPRLTASLIHRPPSGEYRMVTHVLALENSIRVRADTLLVLVDRPVDELSFRLPANAGDNVVISGPGVKEVTPDPATGARRVRFAKPWIGTRQFRVEYEAAQAPSQSAPVPLVDLELATQDRRLGSERYLVLQSRGSVEIRLTAGPGLIATDVDEVPSFADPWPGGRVLEAYRLRSTGDPGTFGTTVHERAPVLRTLARELRLATVIGRAGSARTRAEILLSYSRESHIAVRLPAGSRCLSLAVNDEPIRAIRPGATPEEIVLPLPPLSHARVALVYETPDTSGRPALPELGVEGRWRAEALVIPGIAVGETRWSLRTPAGFDFSLEGGNFRSLPPAPDRGDAPSFEGLPLAGGKALELAKLGGDGTILLAYRSERFEESARRTAFLATFVLGSLLALAAAWRTLGRGVLALLLLSTVVPIALGGAPSIAFLSAPVAAGVLAVLPVAIASALVRYGVGRRRAGRAALSGVALAVAALLTAAPSAQAGEKAADDVVLIPYDPARPGDAGRGADKVYIARGKFLELWRLAHPELEPPQAAPTQSVLTNARYRIDVDGGVWRLRGVLDWTVLEDRWTALPLPFDGHITRVMIDGREAGIAQAGGDASSGPTPTLPTQTAGRHEIVIEATGEVKSDAGVHQVATRVLAAPATSVVFAGPKGARITSPSAYFPAPGEPDAFVLDVGAAGRIDVQWTLPSIEGRKGSQLESISLTLLAPVENGLEVIRFDRVRVSGEPVAAINLRVLGGWMVTDVAGNGLAAWNLAGGAPAGAPAVLQISLARPAAEVELRVRGVLASVTGRVQVPGLILEGAARQEGFVGLNRSERWRFSNQILDGMSRASQKDLERVFALGPGGAPDRIYHAYGTGEGETVAIEAVRGDVEIATSLLALIEPGRAAVSARSRYTVKELGPLRHEVALPEGWTVRTVKSDDLASWDVVADGERRLVLRLRGRATSGTEIVWAAERKLDGVPAELELPRFASADVGPAAKRESIEWTFAASDDLELSPRAGPGLVPVSLESAPSWIELPALTSARFAFRSTRPGGEALPVAPRIGLSRRSSLLGATLISVARLAEGFIHVNARAIARVRLGGRDRFQLRLPPGADLTSLETRNERSRAVRREGEVFVIDIALQSPVTGEQAIDFSYRLPRAQGAAARLVPATLLDDATRPAEADQFVAVLQSSAALITAGAADGLVPAEAESLPFLPGGVPAASLRPVYRATRADWSLEIEERVIEVARSGALVELAELTTVIGGDGIARTRAHYTVRNRGLQFLSVEMPEGSTLWGVELNGRPAAVGRGAAGSGGERHIRVPLEYVGSASLDLEVTIHYEERPLDLPSLRGRSSLASPSVLDVQVVETVWNVLFPDGYSLSRSGGNMREVATSSLYARRTGNLLEQLDRISKAATDSESSKVRDQAIREMARVEQALGDNLAELAASNRSATEAAQAPRIGQKDVERQWASNDALIQRSETARQGLREARQEREKSRGGEPKSKEEQAFLDTTNYLKRSWETNSSVRAEPPAAAPNAAPPGVERLDELLDGASTAPQAGFTLRAAGPEEDAAKPVAPPGLKPLPEAAGPASAPGVAPPPTPEADTVFTFVHQGGEARLELAYTRADAYPRLGAAAALVLALGAWLALELRARKR